MAKPHDMQRCCVQVSITAWDSAGGPLGPTMFAHVPVHLTQLHMEASFGDCLEHHRPLRLGSSEQLSRLEDLVDLTFVDCLPVFTMVSCFACVGHTFALTASVTAHWSG